MRDGVATVWQRFGMNLAFQRLATGLGLILCVSLPGYACKCPPLLDVCAETLYSNVVFVGTVESITPDFMTHWKPSQREPVAQINSALEQYLKDRSPAHFSALKQAVRSALPGLPEEEQQRLETAGSTQALSKLLSSILDGSRRVRFHVRTLFRNADDDDDHADDGDEKAPETLEVLTPFGECGNDFQAGETYLVYATNDEETGVLSTDICYRTRRATDAGADIAYLSFYKDRRNPAGRVQGFATFDVQYQVHPREAERIALPVEGLTIELRTPGGARYTATNQFGQFVFDGLDGGDYKLSAYGAGFPDLTKIVSVSRPFHLDSRACSTQVLPVVREAQ